MKVSGLLAVAESIAFSGHVLAGNRKIPRENCKKDTKF
jgi:hypothetical protein